MFGMEVVWGLSVSMNPYLLKVILNFLAYGSPTELRNKLVLPIGLYLGMEVALNVARRLYDYFVNIQMLPHMREKIMADALGKLLEQDHEYFQDKLSGSLANKVEQLANSVPSILQTLSYGFFAQACALTIAFLTLARVSSLFACLSLVWALLFIAVAAFFSKRLAVLSSYWAETGSVITGRIVDVLANILSVRLFAAKQVEKDLMRRPLDAAVKAEQKVQWVFFWIWSYYGFSALLLQGINFYLLYHGWQQGWVAVGDFALVLGINSSVSHFVWTTAQDGSKFVELYGRIAQALGVLQAPLTLRDKDDAQALAVTGGQISFAGVKFQYKDSPTAFCYPSLVINAGQKVGLVGYSGAGKSTFVNLLLRLYEVTEGQILIDSRDIKSVSQDSLHSNIALIPQDPSLFHRSIRENIWYGRASATEAEVCGAAKLAHAHEFITKLPFGYDTLVGERGIKLSGGQRQRVAIARAILQSAPILILDEATSQLDSLTEGEIQSSLQGFMQGKTAIVIAHRLSTVLCMDRILVFDGGRIAQDGSHEELLRIGGLYKKLWEAQLGGFLPEKNKEQVLP
jgi:ATP-binding cassette subfamily B protein